MRFWHYLFLTSLILTISACHQLPKTPHLPKSIALTHAIHERHTKLSQGDIHKPLSAFNHTHHTQLSGYYPISTGANALISRSILTNMSHHTIDVQYYIWHDDESGRLMLKDLMAAAERGVMVRILLDDFNGNVNLDGLLFDIDQHPNVAVRLVNPMAYRRFRFINYLVNPARTNIRMHNKSMTFDNQLSIIGGRNIGDEYLNNNNNQFADLDVLLTGEVVQKITNSFNEYWHSEFAYDIATLVKQNPILDNDLDTHTNNPHNNHQANDIPQSPIHNHNLIHNSLLGQNLRQYQVPFRWTNIEFVADPATKLGRHSSSDTYLVAQLQAKFGKPSRRLSIISSYFVPTKDGVQMLASLAKEGVDIRILTNSYDATDVGAVHAGYGHWRKELLTAGVRLFELKSTATSNHSEDNKLWRTPHQTTTSLHAKAFAVDDQQVFIGSYNIDPRSANINTELGVIIYDNHLSNHLHQALGDNLLHQAYEVKLNQGKLEWHTLENNQLTILTKEPNMQFDDKLAIFLMSLMPIDGLL